jgi:hypothetical protein
LRKARYTYGKEQVRNPDKPIQSGDESLWEWHNWDGQEKGMLWAANGSDTIEFSFAGNSKVRVRLEDVRTAVLVTLRPFEIPTEKERKRNRHYGCSKGWTFGLAKLKAFLEHGILLNETAPSLNTIVRFRVCEHVAS